MGFLIWQRHPCRFNDLPNSLAAKAITSRMLKRLSDPLAELPSPQRTRLITLREKVPELGLGLAR
jgi:hypothetical protein